MNKADKLKAMINTANYYYIAYTRCMEQRPIDLKTFQMLPIPAITCLTFSCEVYLKTLLFYFDLRFPKGSKGHDLKELYTSLPDDIKTNIRESYENPLKFGSDLDDTKEYFVTSRYLYEEELQRFNIEFIVWFRKKLKEVVDNQIN